MTRLVLSAACLLLLLCTPAILPAQASPSNLYGDRFRGAYLSLGYSAVKPNLDETARALFEAAGTFSLGAGAYAELGYDWRNIGVAVGMDLAAHDVGGRSGASLAVLGLLRWRPDMELPGAFVPAVQLGYVRAGVGSVELRPSEVPAEFRFGGYTGNDTPKSAALLGNGIRTGIELERSVGRSVAARIGVAMDAVWYTDGTYDDDFLVPEGGMSRFLRASSGLTWRPF